MIHGGHYKALFREAQLGSSAMETIRMATMNAAIALGGVNELGTIEPGKIADMIIIDAVPWRDLRTLRLVYRVFKGGAVYDPAHVLSHMAR
jgi:imidazolonepropionase-like amidohydrolase